jgi:hypothetical protein
VTRARLGCFGALLGGGLAVVATAVPADGVSKQHVTNTQYGFALVLPSGWNQVSLNASSLGALLGPHAKESATFQQELVSQATTDKSKGVAVFAIAGSRDSGGSFPNLSVTVEKGVTATTNQLETGFKSGLQQSGAHSVAARAVHRRYGTAVIGTYSQTDQSSATGKIYGAQIYIPHGATLFILTVTSASQSIVTAATATLSLSFRLL